MGHHYVPQEYLRAWEIPGSPGMILTNDKKELTSKPLPIKRVAQAPGYYEAEVEAELNVRLEGPANIILEELRNLRPITEEQRIHFAIYTATMMKRVPRRRRINREDILPRALTSTMDRMLAEIQAWATTTTNKELAAQRLAEIDNRRRKFPRTPGKPRYVPSKALRGRSYNARRSAHETLTCCALTSTAFFDRTLPISDDAEQGALRPLRGAATK